MSNSSDSKALTRITKLLDEGSFVEIGALVTARSTDFNMSEKKEASDGIVTGYGTVDGRVVYVYAQNSDILGGSMGEMHTKKIIHIYHMAMKMGSPVVGLVDCTGIRLEEATDALFGFGKIFKAQAMASGVVPQVQAIFGLGGGGLALSAGLADFVFMEDSKAELFVNAPNTITDKYHTKDDESTADAAFHNNHSGLISGSGSEDEIISKMRTLLSIIPSNNEDESDYQMTDDDLNRQVDIAGYSDNPAAALASISDNGFVFEMKKDYAPKIVTAFIKLNGATVGAIATAKTADRKSNVIMYNDCTKAASFIEFCDAFNIPILTLSDIEGFVRCDCTEVFTSKACAKMIYAYADAVVPKVTVVTGKALGSAGISLGSKAIGADVVYAWDNATISPIEPKEAAKIIYADEIDKASDSVAAINDKTKEYEKITSSISAATRGYIDDVISPMETRQRVIAAFEMLYTKREDRPIRKHGTV